jgi:CDGSH-type Zn-finger protein
MDSPKIAKNGPYIVEETAGKKVWCSCGVSKKQPYCDGSHAGTGFYPEFVHLDEAKKVAWCGCKQSANKPYCDGSHNKLK